MHERFQLYFGAGAVDFRNLFQRKLARQNNALHAQTAQKPHRFGVGCVGLRGHVDIERRRGAPRQRDQPDIRNDGAVRPRAFEKTEILFRRREIGVARENIDRHVEFSAQSVRVFHRLGEFAVGKVARLRAEGKIFAPDVCGVRAEIKRRLQFFKIARGREQFGSLHVLSATSTPSSIS